MILIWSFYYAVNTKQLRRSIQYDENRLFFSGEELTDSYRQLLLECLLNGEYLCSHIDEAISALKRKKPITNIQNMKFIHPSSNVH